MYVPSNIVVNTDPGLPTAVVWWHQPSATDNSGETVTIISNLNPGDIFFIGITNITYTASDTSGNKVSFIFTVTVKGKIPRKNLFVNFQNFHSKILNYCLFFTKNHNF